MTLSGEMPAFPFEPPAGYGWLVEQGLVGFAPSTALQPWYFLGAGEAFVVSERWPRRGDGERLYGFARRQDGDDLACFAWGSAGEITVAVVHGWTPDGYEVVARYATVWEWLKSVVDDMAEVCAAGG